MAGISKKPLVLGFIAYFLIFSGYICSTAEAESTNNDILQPKGLEYCGIYNLRELDPTLTGEDVKFGLVCRSFTYIDDEPQNDYRPAVEHNCFKSTNFNFYDEGGLQAGISPHSTAVCSILFGEDTNAYNPLVGQFHFQGTSPQAQVEIYEFRHFLVNNVSCHTPPAVDIITADFGYPFEEWWTRGIESLIEQYGVIVVAGIGNGSDASDSVLYPAAGANVIGVGLVNSVNNDNPEINLAHFALAYPENSSFGPTYDRRCKPDIIAPGNCLAADVNSHDKYEPTGNWSSFSTPIVTGAIGMLVQKAKQEPELSNAVSSQGGNCIIKAILLNSATKLPYWHKGQLQTDDDHVAPLDYIQGAGMLNAVGAYENLVAGQQKPGKVSTIGWDLNQLDINENIEYTYRFSVTDPADKYISTTIAWNRHYENVYPFESLTEKDANLRLELWAVDPNNSDNNYMLDYSDSTVDNIEHIYAVADAGYTNYAIFVSISDIDENAGAYTNQQYGLAWNVSAREESDNILWYDLNADGIVDDSDLTVMLMNLLESNKFPENYLIGDINPDGIIDVNDLKVLWAQKNQQADW